MMGKSTGVSYIFTDKHPEAGILMSTISESISHIQGQRYFDSLILRQQIAI